MVRENRIKIDSPSNTSVRSSFPHLLLNTQHEARQEKGMMFTLADPPRGSNGRRRNNQEWFGVLVLWGTAPLSMLGGPSGFRSAQHRRWSPQPTPPTANDVLWWKYWGGERCFWKNMGTLLSEHPCWKNLLSFMLISCHVCHRKW